MEIDDEPLTPAVKLAGVIYEVIAEIAPSNRELGELVADIWAPGIMAGYFIGLITARDYRERALEVLGAIEPEAAAFSEALGQGEDFAFRILELWKAANDGP